MTLKPEAKRGAPPHDPAKQPLLHTRSLVDTALLLDTAVAFSFICFDLKPRILHSFQKYYGQA
jgi:hypothetical protein